MVPVDETIEEEKLAFFLQLEKQYPTMDIEDISIATREIERLIEYKILDRILSNIARIFCNPRLSANGTFFNMDGLIFEMSVAQDVQSRSTLLCSCLCRSADKQLKPLRLEYQLEGMSQYSRVIFFMPGSVKRIDEVFLKALVTGIFDVAHSWLSEAIRTAVSKATGEANQALYQFMRVMLPPDPKLLEGFLFSILVKEKGASKPEDIVVLDDMAINLAMKAASKSARNIGRNPEDIAMEVVTEIVPIEDSVIPDVCSDGNAIDINLRGEKYYQASTSFNLALQAVWGPTVTCFPIITDGQLRLVAFYKTEHKNILTPFLKLHKAQLEERALFATGYIKRCFDILRKITKPSESHLGFWAELIGRFAGGFEKSAH